jgi:ATP-dependent Zn protease
MTDPRFVAYHEAGHAVVALALGLRVRGATIVPDDATLGGFWYRTDVAVDDWVAMKIAGLVAVAVFADALPAVNTGDLFIDDGTVQRFPETVLHARGDLDDLFATLGRDDDDDAPSSFVTEVLEGGALRATTILRTHRGVVEAIAQALLERNTLTAVELRGFWKADRIPE